MLFSEKGGRTHKIKKMYVSNAKSNVDFFLQNN